MKNVLLIFLPFIISTTALGNVDSNVLWDTPNWSENFVIDQNLESRENIYNLDSETLKSFDKDGRLHALNYPVIPTGIKIPYDSFSNLLNSKNSILKKFLLDISRELIDIGSPDDLYRFIGLNSYPTEEGSGVYFVPFKNNVRPDYRMGITIEHDENGRYLTASCVACHSENLFGKPIIGLTKKIPNANHTFDLAGKIIPLLPLGIVKSVGHASDSDMLMWKDLKKVFHWIDSKTPSVVGLDTSLATVAMSLSKREDDEDATITKRAYLNPRETELSTFVADSKPLPWFAVKYKTRWLADGSVVSGNPILTNILWNEAGRGADLKVLTNWILLPSNKKMVEELTAAVFNSKPPRYTDFFKANTINLSKAKAGQKLFVESCQNCHGSYEKAWDQPNSKELSEIEILETVKVNYPKQTKVKDVGTDSNRARGMDILAPMLNKLALSKTMGIKVIPQKGYVPPPLIGIWARWPYFHNNSAPTLYDVLSLESDRRKSWYVGEPLNPKTDFDANLVGFPMNNATPKSWKTRERFFDTSRNGLTNVGHFVEDFNEDQKFAIIEFLKTL